MSEKQKEQFTKLWASMMSWLNPIFLAANLFFLTEVYSDFKESKVAIQYIKEKLAALETKVNILTDYDLKSKR
jgi:hypothetical protein